MLTTSNKVLKEHRRWMILYLLTKSPEYSSNSDIVQLLLREQGIPVNVEDLEEDLKLLERRHCLILDRYILDAGVRFWVVRMTKVGQEVYDGIRSVDGVKQNGPLR